MQGNSSNLEFCNYSREDISKIYHSVLVRSNFSVDSKLSIDECFSLVDDNQISVMNAGLCEMVLMKHDFAYCS